MTMTLAKLRERAGLSQAEMAEKMGVSRAQVSRIEASYPDVMFPALRRYMDALDTTVVFAGPDKSYESDDIEQDVFRSATVKGKRSDPSRGFRQSA